MKDPKIFTVGTLIVCAIALLSLILMFSACSDTDQNAVPKFGYASLTIDGGKYAETVSVKFTDFQSVAYAPFDSTKIYKVDSLPSGFYRIDVMMNYNSRRLNYPSFVKLLEGEQKTVKVRIPTATY